MSIGNALLARHASPANIDAAGQGHRPHVTWPRVTWRLALASVLAPLLSGAPATAAKRMFGADEHLVALQDIDLKGPKGEALYLGHKYAYHAFILPYRVTDDGYVLGIKGERSYFKLDEARIKSLQAGGQLPTPLPPYELSWTTLAFGHMLWGLPLIPRPSPWSRNRWRSCATGGSCCVRCSNSRPRPPISAG